MTMLEFINKYHEGYRPEKIKVDLGFSITFTYEKDKSDLYFNIDTGEEITNDLSIFACLLDDDTKVEILKENNKVEHYDMVDNFEDVTKNKLLNDLLSTNFEHINEELEYLINKVNKRED